jgi:hypothetical protein
MAKKKPSGPSQRVQGVVGIATGLSEGTPKEKDEKAALAALGRKAGLNCFKLTKI